MLDDTYYDDFFNVLHNRIFKNKLSMIDYEEIINNLGKEKNYFNDYLKLI